MKPSAKNGNNSDREIQEYKAHFCTTIAPGLLAKLRVAAKESNSRQAALINQALLILFGQEPYKSILAKYGESGNSTGRRVA